MSSMCISSGAFTPLLVVSKVDSAGKFILKSVGFANRVELKILSTSGATIYRSDDYDNSWDGSNAPAGTYYYEVTVFSRSWIFERSDRGWVVIKG